MTVYSIEYYAGRGTKSSIPPNPNTVTDSNKNFNLYLPSLVGYVVVISDDLGNNVAKGTVTSNTATSFTVNAWTNLPKDDDGSGSIPADGTVGYYFSATGHTMMCSDCHSNDTISSTAAQGPHGSAVKWILKGRNRAWPTKSASENGTGTGTPYKIGGNTSYLGRSENDGTANGLFCLNCHSTVSFSKDSSGREFWGSAIYHSSNPHYAHSYWAGPYCINCHIMVPHGGKMSRLIGDGDGTMPARYAFSTSGCTSYPNTCVEVTSFYKEPAVGLYTTDDCSSLQCTGATHGSGTEDW